MKVKMKNFAFKQAGAILLLAVFCAGSVHAREVSNDSSGTAYAKVKKKSVRGGKTKFLPGSAETVSERSARLKRECRGAVNAGACAGYTR